MIERFGVVAVAATIVFARGLSAQSLPPATQQRRDALAASEYARDRVASLTMGVVTTQGLVWVARATAPATPPSR